MGQPSVEPLPTQYGNMQTQPTSMPSQRRFPTIPLNHTVPVVQMPMPVITAYQAPVFSASEATMAPLAGGRGNRLGLSVNRGRRGRGQLMQIPSSSRNRDRDLKLSITMCILPKDVCMIIPIADIPVLISSRLSKQMTEDCQIICRYHWVNDWHKTSSFFRHKDWRLLSY